MARLRKCKVCDQQVSSNAASCPACGAPVKRKGLHPLISISVIALVLIYIVRAADSPQKVQRAAAEAGAKKPRVTRETEAIFYATKDVNIRSGPSTADPVVGRLARRDTIKCVVRPPEEQWLPCGDNKWVHGDFLGVGYPPAVEVQSSKFHIDKEFAGEGAVVWTANVRNFSDQYIEKVRVEFTTFDDSDRIVTTDVGFASGLAPGGSAATKGYATYFGTEVKGSVRVTP